MAQKYRVETNQGTFEVELNRPPRDAGELRDAVEGVLRSGKAPKLVEGTVGEPQEPVEVRGLSSVGPLQEQMRRLGRVRLTPFGGTLGEGVETAKSVAPMVLPVAGGAVGGAVGAATLGPGGIPLGAAVGGAAGEGANQLIGLTEPSPEAIALNVAAPVAGAAASRSLAAGGRFAARHFPGAGAALHDIARTQLERLTTIFGPQQSSDDLYALLAHFNPRVQMPTFMSQTDELLTREQIAAAGLKLPGVATTAEALRTTAGQAIPGGGVPFQDIRVNLRRIGDKIRETREAGGEEHGAWKAMRKSIMDDLETAAAQGNAVMPAVQTLKAANAAFRREAVTEEIADIFSKGGLTSRPDLGPTVYAVNFGRIADGLRKGKTSADIKAVLRPDEYKELVEGISTLARQTPNLPPPRGQAHGFGIPGGRIAFGGAVGFLAGPLMGLDPGTGAAIGVMVGTKGVAAMTRLAMSEPGRRILVSVLRSTGGVIDSRVASLLSLAAANTSSGRMLGESVTQGAVQLGQFGAEQLTGENPP